MKSFNVGPNDAGQRLDKFINKTMPALPKSLMYKYIRLKRIKVDGKRAEISTRLSAGSVVDAYINDEFFEKGEEKFDFLSASRNLEIVYEDENIMLIDKKQGVLVHPDNNQSKGIQSATLSSCQKHCDTFFFLEHIKKSPFNILSFYFLSNYIQ